MTSASAHDFAWIRSSSLFRNAMESGCGLTLVRGVAPGDVLRAMGAEPLGAGMGVDALIERHGDLRDATDCWDDSFVVGACTGDWSLILQFDGGVGMRPRFLEALTAGGRAVVHSTDGGAPIDLFHRYEDGDLRTTFRTVGGSVPERRRELRGDTLANLIISMHRHIVPDARASTHPP
ncbi:DUF6461 domain-containing protein [Streptomyces sp. NPDC060035]|uniref:DUF6461 domain-containing protein n=1 Tax=Streptomyces sp. NPDC060035 TaxID=3347044 RepID=UPI0036CA5E07